MPTRMLQMTDWPDDEVTWPRFELRQTPLAPMWRPHDDHSPGRPCECWECTERRKSKEPTRE